MTIGLQHRIYRSKVKQNIHHIFNLPAVYPWLCYCVDDKIVGRFGIQRSLPRFGLDASSDLERLAFTVTSISGRYRVKKNSQEQRSQPRLRFCERKKEAAARQQSAKATTGLRAADDGNKCYTANRLHLKICYLHLSTPQLVLAPGRPATIILMDTYTPECGCYICGGGNSRHKHRVNDQLRHIWGKSSVILTICGDTPTIGFSFYPCTPNSQHREPNDKDMLQQQDRDRRTVSGLFQNSAGRAHYDHNCCRWESWARGKLRRKP